MFGGNGPARADPQPNGAPAWVRNGSVQVQREYALGLQFERLLVQQLASTLDETTEPSGEEEGLEENRQEKGG